MKAGSTDWILISPAKNHEIEGYASATSVNRGEQISFYVSTADPTYTISIYRTGWYGGAGARKVAGPIVRPGTLQPMPAPDPATGLIECKWSDPYTLSIPNSSDQTDWASGVYLAKLTSDATNFDSYIVFVVRDDARSSTHYFQTSVTTYQAYNEWGGKSLYGFNSTDRIPATTVSFNRPYLHGGGSGEYTDRWELNMVRFLEREGYDVTYCTDIDTHRRGALIRNHRDFLSVGHDEYWTNEMRTSVTAARDAGVNLGFFSANTCYWQIRLEPSKFDSTKLDRTIVAYKETYTKDPYYTDGDPSNDSRVTNQWRLPPVNDSEDGLLGVMYVASPVDGDIVIDDVTTMPWVFENTGLASGSRLPGLLGYEVDKIGARTPGNAVRLGHSFFTTNETDGSPNVSDYSDMTMYTAPSGAMVFATGSIQWAWGLDNFNKSANGDRTNAAAQQMTRNILKRFAGSAAGNDCQYALSPRSANVNSKAGSLTFAVTSFCSWTVSSDAPWVSASPMSGSGNATITLTYEANSTSAARVAHIQVGDRVFTVTQAKPCTYEVSPSSFTIGSDGGSRTVSITTDGSCFWSSSVSSSYPWITIVSGKQGSGNGETTFSVASNPGPSRNGIVVVAGNAVTVAQSAAGASTSAKEILWRNYQTGQNAVWRFNGTTYAGTTDLPALPNTAYRAQGYADMTGDGGTDVVWRNTTSGQNAYWIRVGSSSSFSIADLPALPNTSYEIGATGDLNGDGHRDIFWRNYATGHDAAWLMNGTSLIAIIDLPALPDRNWRLAGSGDFNGDAHTDVVWRNVVTGQNAVWLMNGATLLAITDLPVLANTNFVIGAIIDFNDDGKPDIVFRNQSTGHNAVWLMNGVSYAGTVDLPVLANTNYEMSGPR